MIEKFSKKKNLRCPPERNSTINKKKRVIYYASMFKPLENGRTLISIDETGFNNEETDRSHYALSGCHWDFIGGKKREPNTTLLLAVSLFGLIQSVFIKGSCDSVLFFWFIRKLAENCK